MTVIRVEHLSKQYRLGMIGGATLREDVSRWWALKRGKEDPLAKVGAGGQTGRIGERFWALKDVSFEVKQGEILGIIGRNGAGKSTLLKILSRITAPTEGVVKVKGRIGSLLEVGTGFHPELTGRENIYLNGAILGMSRKEVDRKLDEIIAFSEVEQFIDTPVKRYSSGMYVRLAFAVAAHLDPEILIVDEVLAVGDSAFQKKCLGKMGEVASEGRTVLFVSHNMQSVEALCGQGMLLEMGRLAVAGSASSVVETYVRNQVRLGSDAGSLERSTHRPTGPVGITRLYVSGTQAGSRTGWTIHPGDGLLAEVDVMAWTPLSDLSVAIEIRDRAGGALAIANSATTGARMRIEAGSGKRLLFELESLPLRPGTYVLAALVRQRGVGVLDERIADCGLEVLVPCGRLELARHSGPIYCESRISSADFRS